MDGSTVLKTSAPFANNEQRTDEYCLTATTNNQYTFLLKDTYQSSGDSWASGSWVSVAGLYGNIVFKNYMTERVEEYFALSLYYPVTKGAQWKMLATDSSISNDWYSLNFSDGSWQSVTLGSASSVSGTQYFRKTFTGLPNMAAYEVELNYKFGIIAFVNGVEVFRDYMPDGVVSPSTPSSGSYSAYEYHGFIRPAKEVEANSVLAVELHFPTTGSNNVEFDAFVASLASTTPRDDPHKCFIYPYSVSFTSSGGVNPGFIFNFIKGDYFTGAATVLPATVTYTMNGPRQHVNGVRVWPYTTFANAPGSFTWEGSMDATTWTSVLSVSGATYESGTYRVFYGMLNAKPFKTYHITISSPASTAPMYGNEVQPVTCADLIPTSIVFYPASYSVFAEYEEVNIHPMITEFSACSVAPTLPAGLSLNAATCTITGKATAPLTSTTFTMTSTLGTQSFQGTFTLEVTSCTGTLASILRTYKSSPYYEAFTIKDAATQQVVLSVAANSGQPTNQDKLSVLCMTGPKYEIDVTSSNYKYWGDGSFLYVNAMLSQDEYETIARIRYDVNLGLPEDRVISGPWSVAPHAQWSYKMGEVPANWFGADTSGWSTAAMGAFPASSNTIQLYKTTFTVSSLTDVAGFVVSLRYLYGCVIYMNGVEVFRNGVEGDVSASSTGLNAYTDLLYRQISLPAKTMGTAETPSVNYLQEGTNTIAIAIIAQTASQTTSVFDCAVRLVDASSSRVFDYTTVATSMSGNPTTIANHYYNYNIYYNTCADNSWTITFAKDRREWINAVTVFLHYQQDTQQPKQFVLKARNTNLEEWTTLKTVTGMTWSLRGEHKRIWIENSKPWNQYRFENFATGDPSECYWKIGTLDLSCEVIPTTIPDLSYSTPITVIKDIEMGETYPNSDYYYDFTVTPALPAGLTIDANTGKISGTASAITPAADYQITAKSLNGGSKTFTVNLAVGYCTGDRSFITLVARLDSWPSEGSYKLFSGKGTSGQIVYQNTAFKVKSGLNYGDFCVAHGIYTLELYDSANDGWTNPAGWYLTIDVGAMVFEMGQMHRDIPSMSTLFSSLLPFQIDYDTWKVWNSAAAVAEGWKSVSFDDSAWTSVKAADFGNHMGTTAYIRHEVTIPAIEDYYVLNVRVKYTGGVAAYFNGRLVARFNLADDFEADTEATAAHDATLFSKFHVVLPTVGAVTGKNVMAFEIHRVAGQSELVFDATGVFGVNECSPVLDTYSEIDSSEVSGCTKEDLLDILPTTYGNIPNALGAFLSWTVENLEGSKFNSFAIHTNTAVSGYGFSVYGRWEEGEDFISALAVTDQSTKNRERSAWAMPVGIAGFTQFRFVVDMAANIVPSTNAYVMQYCKPSGSGSCPAVGDYPSVGEGEISPAKCADGFRGYAYRTCTNGQLGDVQNDKCEYKVPARLNYNNNNMEFIMGTEVSSGVPRYRNIITEFFMQDSTPLPEGFSLNPTTGEITGMPQATMNAREFTVRGKNPAGETFAAITISVRKGYCLPEGVFERTNVGEMAVYNCALQGSYVGTQTRACVLGAKNGEWQKASGFCMPVFGIVLIVVVVIVVVVVVVMILMRSRKTKAIGGVKGKGGKSAKAAASKKGAAKKPATKQVKV